jgi:hypothetical protein
VAVRDFNFNPVNISIMAGQTAVWKWEVVVAAAWHSLRHQIQEFGIPAFYQESACMTFFRTFMAVPVFFPYHCRRLHGGPGGAGMSGIVVTVTHDGYR